MISESDRDILGALTPGHIFQGLTARMEEYAQLRFGGATASEAYLEVYGGSEGSALTVRRNARKLDRDSRVIARVRQLMIDRNRLSSLAPSLSRDFILNGIMEIAMLGEKESNRLNAYITLGKTVGIDLFRDVHVTERRERSADEIDAELRAKLEALQRGMTIEGASRPVESVRDVLSPGTGKVAKDRRRKPMAR